MSTFKIEIVYSASAPSENLSSNITDRIALLTNICKKYFSNCVANFTFWGDAKICQAYYKRKKTTLSLNFQTSLMQGEQYVLLVKLSDYYNFLKDDDGKLRFYLFDSNVRAFMGLNSVNTDILASLNRQDGPDFWWLNNGITILGDSVTIAGYAMSITNVQIVNGLQTSQCIFTHFANGNVDDPRFVLIKVLTNKDASVRDSIIRATNNQTNVEIASLRATDKIQRDIEEELKQQGLYYERRTNFYADQGISPEKIFNLLFLASGYVALILKNPDKAVRLRNRFTRDPKEYQAIFSEKTDLRIWPKIATLLRRTEEQLIKERTTQTGNLDSFLKSSRYLVSYLTLSRLLKKFDYGVDDFLAFDVSSFSLEEIHQTWVDLSRYLTKSWDKRCWRKPSFVSSVIQIESLRLGMALPASQKNRASSFSKKIDLSDSFVDLVKSALPPQPWPEKVVVTVATQLKVKPEKVIAAINKLIEKGDVYLQLNGHLFDQKGNEIIPS